MSIVIREKWVPDSEYIRELVEIATAELRRVYKPRPGSQALGRQEEVGLFVAVMDGRVIGMVEHILLGEEIYLQGLAVHPAQRGNGIASSLVSRVELIARRAGRSRLALKTIKETGNPVLFSRLGFAVITERQSERFVGVSGQPVTEVEMAKDLH